MQASGALVGGVAKAEARSTTLAEKRLWNGQPDA